MHGQTTLKHYFCLLVTRMKFVVYFCLHRYMQMKQQFTLMVTTMNTILQTVTFVLCNPSSSWQLLWNYCAGNRLVCVCVCVCSLYFVELAIDITSLST